VALSYRIFVYVCYSAIGLAVVKGIWIAAYNARGLERLEKAVQVNEVLMSDDFTL
jgi:hypothetical protein